MIVNIIKKIKNWKCDYCDEWKNKKFAKKYEDGDFIICEYCYYTERSTLNKNRGSRW